MQKMVNSLILGIMLSLVLFFSVVPPSFAEQHTPVPSIYRHHRSSFTDHNGVRHIVNEIIINSSWKGATTGAIGGAAVGEVACIALGPASPVCAGVGAVIGGTVGLIFGKD